MTTHVEYVPAAHATPEWLTGDELSARVGNAYPSHHHVLALWFDDLVVLQGSVADIRALLVRALDLLPPRTDNYDTDNNPEG